MAIKIYNSEDFGEVFELSDFPILNNVRIYEEQEWYHECNIAQYEFKNKFGIDVLILGRSGRHICVEMNGITTRKYNSMKKFVEKWQNKMMKKYV